jgi:hypothetical protein
VGQSRVSTSYATDVRRLREDVGELVARHGQTRDVADFRRYRGRPVEFFREELGFEPWAKQIEMAEAFHAHRRVVVPGAHGTGKDACLAPLMLYAAYVCGMLVLGISATERQLLNQLWRELGKRFSARLPGELYTADLRIGGEKRVIAMTSGSVSSLTGWHDSGGVFVAISEAQGEQVEAAAFDAAIANAVDDASRIMVVGNPVKAAGRFYEVSRSPTWHTISISALDHPNVIEGRVVIPGGPSPTWPAEMAAEFGIESPFYVARVLGEFPTTGSVDSLVRLKWLEDAYARWENGPPGFAPFPRPVVALDVGRSLDRDPSVAAVVQGARLHAFHPWYSRDLVNTAEQFLRISERARMAFYAKGRAVRPENAVYQDTDKLREWLTLSGAPFLSLWIDAPGVGSGCVDECRRRGRDVTEYWGWLPARDEKRFANERASVHWNFRTLLESGRAALPRDPMLEEEALALEWSQDAKGRIVMLSKDELRKTLKRSTNHLDVACMGLAASTGATRAPSVAFSSVEV